jgi:hypothetical protein
MSCTIRCRVTALSACYMMLRHSISCAENSNLRATYHLHVPPKGRHVKGGLIL